MKEEPTKSRFLLNGRVYRAVHVRTGGLVHIAKDREEMALCRRKVTDVVSGTFHDTLDDLANCKRCWVHIGRTYNN